MEARPKIKLTLSPTDKAMEFAAKIFLAVMWGLTVYSLIVLPTIIPIHFSASGKPDNYGNKLTLLFLPVIGTMIYFGFTQLNKYPHVFNYIPKITEENAEKQYTIATRLMRYMKLAILILLSVIISFVYLTLKGITNGLGVWFLPFVFALIFIPTIISVYKASKS